MVSIEIQVVEVDGETQAKMDEMIMLWKSKKIPMDIWWVVTQDGKVISKISDI